MKTIRLTSLALTLLLVVSCGRKVSVSETSEDTPEIFPDYAGVQFLSTSLLLISLMSVRTSRRF